MFDNERLKLKVYKPRPMADAHNSAASWIGERMSGMNIAQNRSERRVSPRRQEPPLATRQRRVRAQKTRPTLRTVLLERESEAHFQARLMKLAHVLGWKYIYHTYDSRRSTSGFPDLVMIHPAKRRIAFVELKTMRGRLTAAQVLWGAALVLLQPAVEYYVWRPSDWDALVEILRR